MAALFRSTVTVLLVLAVTIGVEAQESDCQTRVDSCISTLRREQGSGTDFAQLCRAAENYFSCATSIPSCGEAYSRIVEPQIERARQQLRDAGCGACGTATVSLMTLMLTLVAGMLCRQ